jgi:hypothetical protein
LISERCISPVIEFAIRNIKSSQKIPNIRIRPLQDGIYSDESRPIWITRRETFLAVRERISSPKTNKDPNNRRVALFQMLQRRLHSSADGFQFQVVSLNGRINEGLDLGEGDLKRRLDINCL